jgi:hypothetical protein
MADHHETFLTRLQQAKRWNVTKRSVERWGEDEKLSLPSESKSTVVAIASSANSKPGNARARFRRRGM